MPASFIRQRADLWKPSLRELKQWSNVPVWTILFRNIRRMLHEGRIKMFLNTLDRATHAVLQDIEWSMSVALSVGSFMKHLTSQKDSDQRMMDLLHWLIHETGVEIFMEPGWSANLRTVYLYYPKTLHTDVVVMEAGRDLPSLFFYVTQNAQYKGYGYLHFIKEIDPFRGTDILYWTLFIARKLGCTEFHLYDQAVISCTKTPMKSGLKQINELIEYPVSLAVLRLVQREETWYQKFGFRVCSEQKARTGPYYLPWKRESESKRASSVHRAFRNIPADMKAIKVSRLLPALDDILRSPPAKIDKYDLATIWSPFTAYIRVFLKEKPNSDTLFDFLGWLFDTNCIVYHFWQSIWIPFERLNHGDPTVDHLPSTVLHHLVKKYPVLKPVHRISKLLGDCRFFWIDPQTHGHVSEPPVKTQPRRHRKQMIKHDLE